MDSLYERLYRSFLWPLLLLATVHALSSTSDLATPDLSFAISLDKVAHFLIFGLVATSILRMPFFFNRGLRGWIYSGLFVIFYGGLDEWRQSMTPGRAMEFADWLADCAGALVATTLYYKWTNYRELLEYRFKRPATPSSGEGA
jgi:VanZ family protein